jgi:ABC-type multidrug transport system permease subunit
MMTISALISLLIVALILYLIWYVVGMFIKGQPHVIIGIILGLVFLLYALQTLGILGLQHVR